MSPAQRDDELDGSQIAAGLEDELGWSLHRVSTAFRYSALGAVADLPSGSRGYQVLVAVDAGPPSSQAALAQILSIDRTAMTYLIDELETADLVTRHAHPKDRRVRQVTITAAGRKALNVVRRSLRSVEEQLMTALAPDESSQLRALLVRVARSTDTTESCTTAEPAPQPSPRRPLAQRDRR